MLNTHISLAKFDVERDLMGTTLLMIFLSEHSVDSMDRVLIMTYFLLVHSLQMTNHMHLL